jgi:hypothetical protein
MDRYLPARHEASLLVRTAIDGERQQLGSDAAIVQQRAGLCRRAVAGDRSAGTPRLDQEFQYPAFQVDHARGEPVIDRQIGQPDGDLSGQKGQQPLRAPSRAGGGVAGMDAQRPAMCRQAFGVEHAQPVPREHLVDHVQREIGEVLVIDRIELCLGDQPLEVGKLDGDHAGRLQQDG